MNGGVGDSVPAGWRAEVTLQLSRSAAQDTGPVEPGGQLWDGVGDRVPFAASGLRRLSVFQ